MGSHHTVHGAGQYHTGAGHRRQPTAQLPDGILLCADAPLGAVSLNLLLSAWLQMGCETWDQGFALELEASLVMDCTV